MSFVPVIALGLLHVLIHELGHILAARSVGTKIKRVGFNWMGVYVVREKADTLAHNLFIAMAGPGINILTAAVLFALHQQNAWVALFIGAYNLVPVPRSDMSRAIQYWREAHSTSNQRVAKSFSSALHWE